jgi:serine phosphatase RsbU (regulator of sigma subunit)
MAGVYEATGRSAWACLPLVLTDEVLGSLSVAWTEPRTFTPSDVELLEGLAAQCAQVLARLRSREQERAATAATQRMSETLQRSLLTSPPAPDSLRISVRYQPAAQEAQVGGDWYDAFVTAAGSTLLVVGDVNGHDQTAAATMGQVRNLLRGMAYDSDDSPAVLLSRLDAALHGLELDTLATAVLARVEQSASDRVRGVRRVRWSNAGHPPPLLRRVDGSVHVLEGEPDLLLGLDPRAHRGERVVEIRTGSTLLLYTDGLVERRDAGLDEGIARLAGVLARAGGGPADELCDALLDAVGPDGNDDDIALLVLQVDEGRGAAGSRS